jgi:hypothetical protein
LTELAEFKKHFGTFGHQVQSLKRSGCKHWRQRRGETVACWDKNKGRCSSVTANANEIIHIRHFLVLSTRNFMVVKKIQN